TPGGIALGADDLSVGRPSPRTPRPRRDPGVPPERMDGGFRGIDVFGRRLRARRRHIIRASFVISLRGDANMTARAKTIGYWTTTALLVLGVVSGGAAELARSPGTIEGIVRLGYPAYLATILGIWKVLGTVALLAPRFPLLKEWAYAG